MCKNRFMKEMLLKEVVKIRISVSWTSSKPIRQVDWKMNFTITWKLSSLTIVSRASFVKRRYNWRNWSFKIGNNCLMQRVKWNSVFKKQECSYDDSWYKNLFVISNKIHHNVKLGQFIVSYNQKSRTLDCGCCCRKQTYVQNAMLLWFFQQNKMLNGVKIKINDNILPPPTTDGYCGTWDESSPPQDQEKLMITLKYIRNKKYTKIQLKAYRTFHRSATPANILPLEQICHLCCGNISKALSFLTIAKIMSLQGLFWKI